MAKAAAGGGGPDLLLIAAVGAMAFLALRSRSATAGTGVPVGTAAQLRPDYKAQRDLAYTQMGVGVAGSLLGGLSNLWGAGSPDAVLTGGGLFGSSTSDVIEYSRLGGYMGQLGIDATDGWNVPEFGKYNGAYTFGSTMESPSLSEWMKFGA